MKKTHVNHHFVPRFLLEPWAGDDGKLGVFKRLPNGDARYDRLSPKRVAFSEHLYSIKGAEGGPDVFVEKEIFGQHIDDIAAPVHKQLLARGIASLSEEQRAIWAKLLLAGLFRIPPMVEHFRTMGKKSFIERQPLHSLTDIELMDEGLKLMILTIGCPKNNQKMLAAEWSLFKVPPGKLDALTSDVPFAYFGDFFGEEFGLVVPISPSYFFVSASGTYVNRFSTMNLAWMTKATNTRLVQHAQEFVFTTDKRHMGLINKWLGSAQKKLPPSDDA
ncbi:DUF4238 domain-containing protein [Roseateles flavus]|uniref:DUF4238 domain-containing protein n=1 Tax=Roseateles flavus TaxID=3149041 RepID=A0ABV0GGN1_9BURK